MNERRQTGRVPVTWPVQMPRGEYVLVGRAIESSPYGICVAAAPNASLRDGESRRVEVIAASGQPRVIRRDVRHITSDRFGLLPEAWLPVD